MWCLPPSPPFRCLHHWPGLWLNESHCWRLSLWESTMSMPRTLPWLVLKLPVLKMPQLTWLPCKLAIWPSLSLSGHWDMRAPQQLCLCQSFRSDFWPLFFWSWGFKLISKNGWQSWHHPFKIRLQPMSLTKHLPPVPVKKQSPVVCRSVRGGSVVYVSISGTQFKYFFFLILFLF